MAVGSIQTDAAGRLDDEQIIPLASERVDVSIREIVTGEVEISTTTHLRDVDIDEALVSHHAHVERVAIGRIVDVAPIMREEDGVLIIPVIEEVVVVEKRLFLKEEVRIRRSTSTHRHQEKVSVREQEAVVRHIAAAIVSDADRRGGVLLTPEEITP